MEAFLLSLKLASVTSICLVIAGLPLIYLMYYHAGRLLPLWKSLFSLPLVLPPTVLGYYLLIAFRPEGFIASITGLNLAFSFSGLVIASIIFSLPFFVNPIISALEELPKSYEESSFLLGKSRWITFRKILLPNIRFSLLIAIIMSFAHTIGEFGVILMIGGNIPGETRVASIAIYHEVEGLNYAEANEYALLLLSFSFVILFLVHLIQQYGKQKLYKS